MCLNFRIYFASAALLFFPSLPQVATAQGEPLLIIGKGDATLTGGFSYGFITDPLHKPFDYGKAELSLNLPINVSAPIHGLLKDQLGEQMAIPNFTAQAQQSFNTSIDVSAPLYHGVLFFSIRENGRLSVDGSIGNAGVSVDTTKNRDGGRILLKGGVNMPLKFDMYWRSLTFGYAIRPSKRVTLGFQIHNHLFNASTAGNLVTSLTGKIELQTEDASFVGDIPYDEGQIFGQVDGEYKGEAWVPEIGIRFGPFSLVSRMGLTIRAKGYLNSNYSIPFFMDPETLIPKYTEPDSFLTAENIPRLMHAEVIENRYQIRDHLNIKVPQSHTLGIDLFNEKLFISYSKIFGRLEIKSENDTSESDSLQLDTGDYLNGSVALDHITLLSTRLRWFHHNIGFGTFDVGYRAKRNYYSEILDKKLGLPPLIPIWNFGFILGHQGAFGLDFFFTPLPAVRTSYRYVF